MGTFREVEGDLFDLNLPAIGHGCNIRGVMGGGIAAQFRKRWPQMYEEYRDYCGVGSAEPGRFYSYVPENFNEPVIYNMFTQADPGADAKLSYVYAAVQAAVVDAQRHGIKTLGIPRIGAGIGGLDWAVVREGLKEIAVQASPDFELVAVSLPGAS